MRTKQIKKLLDKVGKILEIYEDYSLDEMLDDIISKVAANGEIKQQKRKREKLSVDFNAIQDKIQRIGNQEGVLGELAKLDKNTLIDFGKFVDVKVDKKNNKSSIARIIAGHINFPRLNKKISQRDRAIDFDSE